MVDPIDNQAYLAYDAWGNDHAIIIERLTEDYTDSMGLQGCNSTNWIVCCRGYHLLYDYFRDKTKSSQIKLLLNWMPHPKTRLQAVKSPQATTRLPSSLRGKAPTTCCTATCVASASKDLVGWHFRSTTKWEEKKIFHAIQPTGIEVWTAPNPLGPWTDMNLDLNPGNSLGILGREIRLVLSQLGNLTHLLASF